jgi:hypothetical protein
MTSIAQDLLAVKDGQLNSFWTENLSEIVPPCEENRRQWDYIFDLLVSLSKKSGYLEPSKFQLDSVQDDKRPLPELSYVLRQIPELSILRRGWNYWMCEYVASQILFLGGFYMDHVRRRTDLVFCYEIGADLFLHASMKAEHEILNQLTLQMAQEFMAWSKILDQLRHHITQKRLVLDVVRPKQSLIIQA